VKEREGIMNAVTAAHLGAILASLVKVRAMREINAFRASLDMGPEYSDADYHTVMQEADAAANALGWEADRPGRGA